METMDKQDIDYERRRMRRLQQRQKLLHVVRELLLDDNFMAVEAAMPTDDAMFRGMRAVAVEKVGKAIAKAAAEEMEIFDRLKKNAKRRRGRR